MLEKIRGIEEESMKGGPTYLFMMIKQIVSTSDIALRGITNKINSMKITDYDGENVGNCVTFIKNACKILRDHNSISKDIKTLVLEAFSSTSCKRFEEMVSAIRANLKLKTRDYEVEEILDILETDYNDKIGSGQWTAKDTAKTKGSTFSISMEDTMCLNCGKFGHMVKDCPEPINAEAIAKRKKLLFKERDSKTNGYKGKTPTRKKDHEDNNDSDANKNPKKQPPKKGEPHEKDFNGKKLKWCGKCGRWTGHSTAEHRVDYKKSDVKEPEPNEDSANIVIGGASVLIF